MVDLELSRMFMESNSTHKSRPEAHDWLTTGTYENF